MPAEQVAVPTKKSHRARNIIIILVIVILVISGASYGLGYLGGVGGSGSSTGQRDTWQQWGMSIQYPAGLSAQYSGALQTQATSSSGGVNWIWNNAQSSLGLGWVTTSAYNFADGLQGYYSKILSQGATNIVLLGQGNVTMAGHSWEYESYSWQYQGTTAYSTFAITYYPSSSRGYVLLYQDTSSGTLANLESYGNTFSG